MLPRNVFAYTSRRQAVRNQPTSVYAAINLAAGLPEPLSLLPSGELFHHEAGAAARDVRNNRGAAVNFRD